jgi:S1-C subfamily serine protease
MHALAAVGSMLAASVWAQDARGPVEPLQDAVVVLEIEGVLGRVSSTGTGFFVSEDCVIATNHHVIDGARAIRARTFDGRQLDIEAVLATDVENDLAIIQAAAVGCRPLTIADSSGLAPGDPVYVLGNPLGLDFTLSNGIVSAVRGADETRSSGPKAPHIQFSAPISFGSSGSPVVNPAGEVVAVVASMWSGAQNLNFAVPSNALRALMTSGGDPHPRSLSPSKTIVTNLAISAVFFVLVIIGFRTLTKGRK